MEYENKTRKKTMVLCAAEFEMCVSTKNNFFFQKQNK